MEEKVGAERSRQAEKPTTWGEEERSKPKRPPRKLMVRLRREKWARREIGRRKNPRRGRGKRKTSRKTCGKGDRNAVGLFMRDLSVFSESTQVLQFKLKGSLFVFDRSFVIDCLLLWFLLIAINTILWIYSQCGIIYIKKDIISSGNDRKEE